MLCVAKDHCSTLRALLNAWGKFVQGDHNLFLQPAQAVQLEEKATRTSYCMCSVYSLGILKHRNIFSWPDKIFVSSS